MTSIVTSTLRGAVRDEDEPFNILTFPTHERYETGLARTGHQFFAFRAPGIKDWNRKFSLLPSNYTLLDPDKGEYQIPPDVAFDVVLSQNRLGSPSQFQIAANFARRLQIPHINLEHCLPHPDWGAGKIWALKRLRGDYNVFISDYSLDAWMVKGCDDIYVIPHGIDTDLFKPDDSIARKPMLLSVVNDWINRDYCCGFKFWKAATEGLPCFVVGDTPGLSKPAETTNELIWRYQNADIFVNTSLISPVPMALLEAMSCGCAIISTSTCMIPDFITHQYNGILCQSPEEMKKWCEKLLDDPLQCRRLGDEARQTILDDFNLKGFVDRWRTMLLTASNRCDKKDKSDSQVPLPKRGGLPEDKRENQPTT